MAVIVSDRLLTVGRGRDREGLMPAISGRDRDPVTVRGLIRSAGRPGLFQLVSRGNTGTNPSIVKNEVFLRRYPCRSSNPDIA